MAGEDDDVELEALDEYLDDEQGGTVQGDDEQEDGAEDEAEVQAEGEQEEVAGEDEQQPQRGTRRDRRIQRLTSELKASKDREAERDRQLQEITNRLARQETPRPQAPKEPTEDEMALWSPQQVIDYRVKRGLEPVLQTVQQIQATTYETGDRANFNALCASDQRAAKMRDEVEKFVTSERQRGNNIQREVAYTFLLGQKIRSGAKEVSQQRQQGRARIERQRASGGSPRSDESGQRRQLSEKEARNKRLEDASF